MSKVNLKALKRGSIIKVGAYSYIKNSYNHFVFFSRDFITDKDCHNYIIFMSVPKSGNYIFGSDTRNHMEVNLAFHDDLEVIRA
jgi:hypothetical protein